jgi:tetratricopeptide (TPR) repeat protein
MVAHQFIQQLRNQLSEDTQPWVINALRQDQVVWQVLIETNLAEKALSKLGSQPQAWSPGMLALLGMDLDLDPDFLHLSPLNPLDPQLRQRAYQAYESLMKKVPGNNSPATSASPLDALAEAGWAALALRERFRLTGSWDIFTQELKNKPAEPAINWLTISACLFGLIPDPAEWMSALIYPGAPIAGVSIALHASLSNPMPYPQQLAIFKFLLSKYPTGSAHASGFTSILRELSFQHQKLAKELSSWLIDLGNYSILPEEELAENVGGEHIEKSIFLAEIFQAAEQTDQALKKLSQAQQAAQWLQDGMSAYQATLTASFQSKLLQARRKVDDDPQIQTYLTENMGDGPSTNNQDDLETVIAMAQKALELGNLSRSRELASRALSAVKFKPLPHQYASFEPLQANLRRKKLEILSTLAKLFYDLGLYETCIETTQTCLEDSPNDAELIYLLGKSLQALNDRSKANQAFQVAVMLSPERMDIRSSLAEGLEVDEDWDAALPERQNILAKINQEEKEKLLEAYHKLANCALHAGKLEFSILASKKALVMDPDDGLAFVYLGEATLVNPSLPDRNQAALEYFNQAVQLSPQHPESWLGLAKTYQRLDQVSKAAEILQEAVQAAPLSYEVHFALGEAYLTQGSLTQARQSLQRAYELANTQSAPGGSNDWRVALRLGQALLQLGHIRAASEILSKAYNHPQWSHGKPLELASTYVKILLTLDQVPQALPVLKEIVQNDTQDIGAHLDYANALLAFGSDPEETVQVLQRILSLDPAHLEAQALLAEALAACADHSGALKIYQACLETDLSKDRKWVARISFGLGCSALALNRIDTAIAALQEAIHADPAKVDYHQKLCEAYWAANLNNNAIQAARSALNLRTEDPDTLLWYAEQAVQFYQASIPKSQILNQETPSDETQPDRLYGIKPRQILNEALNALTQAAQIDPQRAEIVLKLGELQVLAGEKTQAVASFQKLNAFEVISQDELQKGAMWLIQLGEDNAAAGCLERIISIHQSQGTEIPSELFIHLSQAYQRMGNIEAAKDMLERALSIYPQQAMLYLKAAQIDVHSNNPDEALHRLEEAITILKEDSDRAEIHYHIAQILRNRSNFTKALVHAELAYQLSETNEVHLTLGWTHLAKHSLVAELSRSLLQIQPARMYLENPFPIHITAEQLDLSNRETLNTIVGFFCLKSELALEKDEEIEAANALTLAVQAAPTHPRSLALQARFQHRRGDDNLAQRTMQEALRQLPIPQDYGGNGASTQVNNAHVHYPNPHLPSGKGIYSAEDYLSLSEAAMELRLWALALYLVEKAIEVSPKEPYLSLRKASIIVRQAEQQHLCHNLDIIQHAPGENAISWQKAQSFHETLQLTRQTLQEQEASFELNQLKNWEIRGLAVFDEVEPPAGHTLEKVEPRDPICWTELSPTMDTTAAQLAHLLRKANQEQSNSNRHKRTLKVGLPQSAIQTCQEAATQAIQKYPQSVLILLLAALTYESVQPPQALQYAQQAASLTKPTITDLTAMCQVLLARLAYQTSQQQLAVQAIDMALSIWQEEPRWHSLAAAISQHMEGADQDEITHLDFAAQLEPKNYTHHINLGLAYARRAENDPAQTSHALQSFEKASLLEPKRHEAWLNMADLYLQQGNLSDLLKAAEMTDRAIAITLANPERKNTITAQLLRAKIALKSNDPELAYQCSQKALAIEPQNTEGAWLKAQALQNLNRPAEALSTLEKAIHQDYEPLHFQLKKAELLRQTQGSEAALTLTRSLAENNPNHPVVLSLFAQILLDTGQKEAALQAAQLALKFNSEQPELNAHEKSRLHYMIGMQFVETGQLDHAIHHLDEAIQLTPDFVEPYLESGFAYNKQRQYLKAQKLFQQATVIAPEDPRPFLHAGLSLKEGKDYLSAETMLRRAAQLAPTDVQIRKHLAAVAALNLVHNPHNLHPAAER